MITKEMLQAARSVTTPQKDELDKHREALIQHFLGIAMGPEPQAPQYQPAYQSPVQSYAMARNPQAAGFINQTIQAPAQAQYQQQLDAFKAAMEGRQQATTGAVSLLNNEAISQYRFARANRPIVKEFNRDVNGQSRRIRQVLDPQTAEIIDEVDLGPAFVAPYIGPGVMGGKETTVKVPRSGGGAVQDIGFAPRPQAGTVEDISDTMAVLHDIEAAKNNPLVTSEVGRFEGAKRMGQEVVRAVPLIGPQASAKINPDMESFESDIDKIRAKVQLKLTGKAVNSQEIKRLLALIPAGSTATDPTFFRNGMDRFGSEYLATMQRQARLHPELFTDQELRELGATTNQSPVDDILQQYDKEYGNAPK